VQRTTLRIAPPMTTVIHRSSGDSAIEISASNPLELSEVFENCIAERYCESIRMIDLARQCNVSPRTLQNLCHQCYGESPSKVLRRFRLKKLHALISSRPWLGLSKLFGFSGLIGSKADRVMFFAMYGLSIRQWRDVCRGKSPHP
jgi:AraC-like DNA-binding protein